MISTVYLHYYQNISTMHKKKNARDNVHEKISLIS